MSTLGDDALLCKSAALAILLHLMKGTLISIRKGEESGWIHHPPCEDIESTMLMKPCVMRRSKWSWISHTRSPMQWNGESRLYDVVHGLWSTQTTKRSMWSCPSRSDSIFCARQALIALRKEHPWLVTADYELVDAAAQVSQAVEGEQAYFWWLSISPAEQELPACQWGWRGTSLPILLWASPESGKLALGCLLYSTSLIQVRKIEEILPRRSRSFNRENF